jgi:hypothetical protein
MSSSSSAARPIAAVRRVAPWLAGLGVLLVRRDAVELAAPAACPGLLDALSIGIVRGYPDLPIGQVFGVLHTIVVVGALAAFGEIVRRRTRSAAIAFVSATAIGLSPLFPAAFAPAPAAAAFGIASAAALVWIAQARGLAASASWAASAVGVLAIAALVVPSWLLPAAALAGAAGARAWPRRGAWRWTAAVACSVVVAALPVAMLSASPPNVFAAGGPAPSIADCVLPAPSGEAVGDVASGMTFWLGPFVLGLALVGAFAEAPIAGWRRSLTIVAVAGACVLVSSSTTMAAVAAAPAAVLLWCLAASGLNEIRGVTGRRPAPQIVAALVLMLVPALSAARRVNEVRDDQVRPRGHEQQTLRQMTALLNLVPQEATFVEEDASVDLLLRAAAFGGRRRLKPVTVLPSRPEAIQEALRSHAIYAFPHAQEELGLRGFVITPLTGPSFTANGTTREIDGVAAITGRRACQTMGDAWTVVSGASGRVALSADSEEARGPVTLYLGGQAAGQPVPDGWPPRTLRGFRFMTFDQIAGHQSERLLAEARDAGLHADDPVLADPFVIRLTLHRTPRAPRGLAAALGAPFPRGVARLEPDATHTGTLIVCDAPPIVITPLPSRE